MKKLIYLSVLTFAFSACSKGPEPVSCTAVENNDCICTEEYAPVCGCDEITYSNTCHANCAGVEVISQGECP